MAMVKWLALGSLFAACYSPDVRDCTVTCATSRECTGGQVCGDDHLCSAPGHACSATPDLSDAAIGDSGSDDLPPDGRPDAPLDAAPAMIDLHVHIDGAGRVVLLSGPVCDSDAPAKGDCHISVRAGVPQTATAEPHDHFMFDRWTSMTCATAGETCVLVPVGATSLSVRFRKADM